MKSKYLKGLQIAIENSKNARALKETVDFFIPAIKINTSVVEILIANDKK